MGTPASLLLVLLLTLVACNRAKATDSWALSPDGNILYSFYDQDGPRLEVDPLPGAAPEVKPRTLKLPDLAGARNWPSAIQVEKSGALLLLTSRGLFRMPADFSKPTRIAVAPQGIELYGMAYDPATGNVLLHGAETKARRKFDQTFWILPAGRRAMEPVFCRHVDDLRCAAFTAEGKLYFGSHGDLWFGTVDYDKDVNPDDSRWVLTASRIAPVGDLVTYVGTPTSTGVTGIVAGEGCVYLALRRMGGSGWGDLWRLPWPQAKPSSSTPFAEAIQALQSMEHLGDQSTGYTLASTPTGSTVLYNGNGLWRVRGREAAEPLPRSILDQQ